MRVLVRIEVSGAQPRIHNMADLRRQFVSNRKASERDSPQQLAGCTRQIAARLKHRASADQDKMATDVERRRLSRAADGIFEGRPVRHQGCCRQNAIAMRLKDSRIYIARETEIVGVYNQALHVLKTIPA